jgi:hypothetical protein
MLISVLFCQWRKMRSVITVITGGSLSTLMQYWYKRTSCIPEGLSLESLNSLAKFLEGFRNDSKGENINVNIPVCISQPYRYKHGPFISYNVCPPLFIKIILITKRLETMKYDKYKTMYARFYASRCEDEWCCLSKMHF